MCHCHSTTENVKRYFYNIRLNKILFEGQMSKIMWYALLQK